MLVCGPEISGQVSIFKFLVIEFVVLSFWEQMFGEFEGEFVYRY